jgi:hypothetical protein
VQSREDEEEERERLPKRSPSPSRCVYRWWWTFVCACTFWCVFAWRGVICVSSVCSTIGFGYLSRFTYVSINLPLVCPWSSVVTELQLR